MDNQLTKLLNLIFSKVKIFFYTVDHLYKKIVIFTGENILEISLIDNGTNILFKSKKLYFYQRSFKDIKKIYDYIDTKNTNTESIDNIIKIIVMYEDTLHKLFVEHNTRFYDKEFDKLKTTKKLLLILKGGGMEETIEKSFISYCNNSSLDLTVLYKFGKGYWGERLNQDGFFNELKANNPNVKFIYREDFNDEYIDFIIDSYIDTKVFSFQYDYKGKHKNINMIVLSSVTDTDIDCSRYKNIFSCYKSKTIGYSTDKFINTSNTKVYNFLNPQNISLLTNYSTITEIDDFILSGGMSWARDFSVLNSLNGDYKGLLVSDEIHKIDNFISMYRGIQNYYGFFGVFKLSHFGVFCHLDEFNDDDRSKMIASSICAGKPVVVPYNDGLIVKEILDKKLGVAYKNGDKDDFKLKVGFFANNEDNIDEYSENCKKYSEENMDVNKFINFIFSKVFNK